MKIIVCGSRTWGAMPDGVLYGRDLEEARNRVAEQRDALFNTLDRVHSTHGIELVVTGAARGADTLAGYWARHNKIARAEFPANWRGEGKAAGVIRNARMLDIVDPDMVVGFYATDHLTDSRGTYDMMRRSFAAGVEFTVVVDRDGTPYNYSGE